LYLRLLALPLLLFPLWVHAAGTKAPKSDWTYVEKRLSQAGFNKPFIKELKAVYSPKDFNEVVELNLLLYLRKNDVHGPQVKTDATATVRQFVSKNKKALKEAERIYGVTPELVASLLWLETRHGKNQGRFHVPSSFVHLLQAERPDVVKHLKEKAKAYGKVDKKVRKEIDERVKRKADWALDELRAIEKIQKTNKFVLKNWKGSFSGAFGMSQFLPSSYLAYAKTLRKKAHPDLTRPDDAIVSVANYLHQNGWKKKKPKTHEASLYRYNKSRDYVAAIMSISKKARAPASFKN
jgi:membrane-bound lytic murein transglycosylase B